MLAAACAFTVLVGVLGVGVLMYLREIRDLLKDSNAHLLDISVKG